MSQLSAVFFGVLQSPNKELRALISILEDIHVP